MNERKLTKAELNKREDIIMKMKDNKRALVQKYGKDAEAVMYGRATKLAKKQAKSMDQDKIREAVKNALQNPKKADLNKDGKLSDYEKKRGAAIEKSMANENQGFGSSDMSALLSSMHRDLGEPKEFPGLSKVMDAAEDATDFYMDDFEEYSTDRDELVMSNARAYARRMFPDFMSAAAKFLEPIDEMDRNDPIAMRLRADKLRQDTKNIMSVTKDDKKLFALKKRRAQLMRDMEQEAEMEGGPIADRYGAELNKIDKAMELLKSRNKDINEENIGLADLEERGYEAGEKAAYTYGTLITKLQNRPDKLAFKKGFVQGVIDELGSNINEDLTEDLDLGHEDNEPHMLKADLYRIGKYAMELYQILDQFEGGSEEVDLPHWWQSKIIKSKDAIVGAKHYLDFEIKEPQIDAMVDVAQDVEAINEFDDESMTAYQKAVKKVYRPKYDGSIQMPSQEEVDAFFKKIGQEDHHLANKPVFGDTEPWDGEDYSDWKNITRGYKLNEGIWSLGSAKEIKNIIGILDIALDIKDPQELMDLMDMHDKSMYNMIGDDDFHDDIDGAKRELAQDNLDGAYNRLIDAKGRAKDLLKMVVDRESSRPYPTDKIFEVAKKLAKQLKSK